MGIEVAWVIGRYSAVSPTGKYILTLLGGDTGYTLINTDRGKMDDVIVGFRRPEDSPLPAHLEYASFTQATGLERKRKERSARQ